MAAVLDISGTPYAPLFLADDSQLFSAASGNSSADASEQSMFEVSDYIAYDESSFAEPSTITTTTAGGGGGGGVGGRLVGSDTYFPTSNMITNGGSDTKGMRVDIGCRIGFRMKSEVEVLDDGFKWRKYGKKSVKNSPNPRNYYRCSSQGCGVKKRVERDCHDPSYVITTYDGVHNHVSPGTVRWDHAHHLPVTLRTSASALAISSPWTAQSAESSL